MPRYHYQRIESKWQHYWDREKTFATLGIDCGRPKLYVLDMFPYPSGAGLHVGHPEGYTATDIICRYKRMCGFNVLHPMGWDAFGLPAEQYAIKNGVHPRITTQQNVDNFRRQIKALGFSYDWDREINTTDPHYYRWTQWIFLKLHDTWFDPDDEWVDDRGRPKRGRGRPIAELPIPDGVEDADLYRDRFRLAYRSEVPVNWCPGLGTVLANEEVIDGKSEVGGFPVERIPLKQWMLRITAYADRLLDDLEDVDWPDSIKLLQSNWIGRSEGAEVDFPITKDDDAWATRRNEAGWPDEPEPNVVRVYTTRPDTLFGATYMVLAPEHPLVDQITTSEQREAVEGYRQQAANKSERDRTTVTKTKSGVWTGAYATNPVSGERIPIWIADYVLMGYGTGAIMAVPGHDERDFEFAQAFDLPIRRVVAKLVEDASLPLEEAEAQYGVAVNSANESVRLDGLPTLEAKSRIIGWLDESGLGRKTVNTKLRDWLFSRQRYWGEPFPVLLEDGDRVRPVDESELPIVLPEMEDFKPSGKPEPPLSKAEDWVNVTETLQRETNTMPQWAGSCWYYLRYLDPHNEQAPWDPEIERYWMPVDLYIGGAEHAVLHLLYARFWHKVLYDRGLVSTPEPFQRLFNQGMILGEMEYTGYRAPDGRWVSANEVDRDEDCAGISRRKDDVSVTLEAVKLDGETIVKKGDSFVLSEDESIQIEARSFKMSKSRGNVINPDDVVADYGADSLRLYEMFMGPLEATKPWSMNGVEGVYRFLSRVWRLAIDEDAEEVTLHPKVQDVDLPIALAKQVARTTAAVTEDFDNLRFNTAISRLMELSNALNAAEVRPKSAIETLVLLLAPLAPHLAEEIWEALGHTSTLAYEAWPTYDPALLRDDEVEIPVQVNGKLRGRITVPADADRDRMAAMAQDDPKIAQALEGKTIRKTIAVPGKLVNFVVSG